MADSAAPLNDAKVSQLIETALGHVRECDGWSVGVSVKGGAVVLSGTVIELWQKDVAEFVARHFQPVRLQNEISVKTPGGAVFP